MTRTRSAAYRRVVQTLGDVGPAKLWPAEEACIREAADALLFCDDMSSDRSAADAILEVIALGDRLIGNDRWTAEATHRLLDDIWACGPVTADALAA